ncbi:MAG: hypothetical protein LBK56_00815 [Gracilibacteraceae bacterium]|jgi:hypothetical protein|nr:hypothetical protein [Gracilibacteraceae bacterium]
MVKGLDMFREYFRDFQGQYVLIGGAACDVVFGAANRVFRATKDLDMVLIVEALTPAFGRRFWEFIGAGGYENKLRSNGAPQFYRFEKPKTPDFPHMIELFTKTESVLDRDAHGCVPLHLDDEISSLSAILLNSDYYQMLLAGRTVLGGLPVLPHAYLILFKAKAWLDLSGRRAAGQSIDSKDIRKHMNDIVRLASMLTDSERCEMPESVRADMERFIEALGEESVDMKALGVSPLTLADILDALKKVYLPQ